MRASKIVVLLVSVLTAAPARAQFAETPVPLSVVTDTGAGGLGSPLSAVQIGRRVFIGGAFRFVSPPTGGAVVTDGVGGHLPNRFPRIDGPVSQIVADGAGGWLVVGDFTSVDGQPFARFARITPERTVDPAFRVAADGPIALVAAAHGRIYLAGTFTAIGGVPRRGLAAVSAATGQLTAFASGFDRGDRLPRALSVSSTGVYLSAWNDGSNPRVWGFDAGSGQQRFSRAVLAIGLAASSARVYVSGSGSSRPIWALDPITGEDTAWTPRLRFEFISGSYGDYTQVNALLLDEGRLYFAGYFRAGPRNNLAAVDAESGAPVEWLPVTSPIGLSDRTTLTRIGPAVVVTSGAAAPLAFGVATGGPRPYAAATYGAITTIAAVPEGVVIGGAFNGIGGTARAGLAAVNLDTGTLDPWTAAYVPPPFGAGVKELGTDGSWLFVRTADTRFVKIDPISGAVAAELQVAPATDYVGAPMRVAGGEILTAVHDGSRSELGAITIATWTYRRLPVVLGGDAPVIGALDVAGATIYLAGRFDTLNGASRPRLGAVDRATGRVLGWRPAPDLAPQSVRAAAGRVWVGGAFRRVGGQRRRGLAELDPVTGAALAWHPDALGIAQGGTLGFFDRIDVDVDGTLYASAGTLFGVPVAADQPSIVSGRRVPQTVAFATATGRRLPWRPLRRPYVAILPDCMLVAGGCLPRAVSAPGNLRVQQDGATVTLDWTAPAGGPARSGVRLEVGTAEGQANLGTLDLPAAQTSITAPLPAGHYFARVRSLAGAVSSLPTADVSFAVGPPNVPAAPLDVTAVADGERMTFAWQPPSTGAPPAYLLEAGTAEGRGDLGTLALAGSATSLSLDIPSGTYWARLYALNGAGRSAPGAELLLDVRPRQVCGGTPLPPSSLSATVTGRMVTLMWQDPVDGPQVDQQKVVAGSAPGLADLGVFDVALSATSLAAAVPPGVYYVRVIADSLCGVSASSNEVRVVVP